MHEVKDTERGSEREGETERQTEGQTDTNTLRHIDAEPDRLG